MACVLVDEAQFLTTAQVQQLHQLAQVRGVPVICYGLRSDFRGDPFPGSAYLLALADDIEEIKNICTCGKKATMNIRVDARGRRIREGEQVSIGGNERYRQACGRCFYPSRLARRCTRMTLPAPAIAPAWAVRATDMLLYLVPSLALAFLIWHGHRAASRCSSCSARPAPCATSWRISRSACCWAPSRPACRSFRARTGAHLGTRLRHLRQPALVQRGAGRAGAVPGAAGAAGGGLVAHPRRLALRPGRPGADLLLAPQFLSFWPSPVDWRLALRSWPWLVIIIAAAAPGLRWHHRAVSICKSVTHAAGADLSSR